MADVKRCHFGLLSDMMDKLSKGEVVGVSKDGRLVYTDNNKVVTVEAFTDLELPDAQYVLEIVGSSVQKNIQNSMRERQISAQKKAQEARQGKGLIVPAAMVPGA